MKCLVTGSAGFIGSHLVVELKKCGHEVIECDIRNDKDKYMERHYTEEGLDEYLKNNDIRTVTEDYLKGVDVVYHLGAASGSLYFDPIKKYNGYTLADSINVNCDGTVHLLEMCRQAGVKKFIFASTASSYVGTKCPHKEKCKLTCLNFYAATKQFGEMACKLYHEIYGMDVTILRFASVYGTKEEQKGKLANIVSQFIWDMMKDKSPELWYKGRQTRDLIYVDDVVDACIFAIRLSVGPYNVGTNVETSFIDVVAKINAVLGTTIVPRFIQPYACMKVIQKKKVDRQLMDTSKLKALGWESKISIDDGIKRIIENIKARK